MEPSIQYCRTPDDVNIAYAVIGDGSPIVFSSTMWGNIHICRYANPFSQTLERLVSFGWAVITYDSRGAGASDRNVGDLSLEGRLRDLESVVERAAPERFKEPVWVYDVRWKDDAQP
jgi:pimeloyl-ACP methyl ester carboxylesterase